MEYIIHSRFWACYVCVAILQHWVKVVAKFASSAPWTLQSCIVGEFESLSAEQFETVGYMYVISWKKYIYTYLTHRGFFGGFVCLPKYLFVVLDSSRLWNVFGWWLLHCSGTGYNVLERRGVSPLGVACIPFSMITGGHNRLARRYCLTCNVRYQWNV